MFKIVSKAVFFLGVMYIGSAMATDLLTQERIKSVKLYLQNLQNKDAAGMKPLFVSNGTVISTSKGKVNAADFFNGFLPELAYSQVTVSQLYLSLSDKDHLGAKFHFSFKLKNGEQGGGDYVDDFSFVTGSNKLRNVSMFENLKS